MELKDKILTTNSIIDDDIAFFKLTIKNILFSKKGKKYPIIHILFKQYEIFIL